MVPEFVHCLCRAVRCVASIVMPGHMGDGNQQIVARTVDDVLSEEALRFRGFWGDKGGYGQWRALLRIVPNCSLYKSKEKSLTPSTVRFHSVINRVIYQKFNKLMAVTSLALLDNGNEAQHRRIVTSQTNKNILYCSVLVEY